MAIGVEHGSYRAAEQGHAESVPEPLWDRVSTIPDHRDVIQEAVELVIEGPSGEVHAWDFLKSHSRDDQEHHDLMRTTLYLAKQDTRYWGVADPSRERYCSTCRHVKPIEMFEDGNYNCEDCT